MIIVTITAQLCRGVMKDGDAVEQESGRMDIERQEDGGKMLMAMLLATNDVADVREVDDEWSGGKKKGGGQTGF